MEQRCSDAVLCNPCAAGHFDSTRKKTMLIFADYTFRGWPLIREKRESLVPRKFRSIRYVHTHVHTHAHAHTHTHTHTHTPPIDGLRSAVSTLFIFIAWMYICIPVHLGLTDGQEEGERDETNSSTLSREPPSTDPGGNEVRGQDASSDPNSGASPTSNTVPTGIVSNVTSPSQPHHSHSSPLPNASLGENNYLCAQTCMLVLCNQATSCIKLSCLLPLFSTTRVFVSDYPTCWLQLSPISLSLHSGEGCSSPGVSGLKLTLICC